MTVLICPPLPPFPSRPSSILPTYTATQILTIFIIATLLILAYAAEIKQVSTYESVIEHVCGPCFKILAELCIIAFCFGTATTFLVVIGDQTVDSE